MKPHIIKKKLLKFNSLNIIVQERIQKSELHVEKTKPIISHFP